MLALLSIFLSLSRTLSLFLSQYIHAIYACIIDINTNTVVSCNVYLSANWEQHEEILRDLVVQLLSKHIVVHENEIRLREHFSNPLRAEKVSLVQLNC